MLLQKLILGKQLQTRTLPIGSECDLYPDLQLNNHPRGNGVVGFLVDEDEAAGVAVGRVGIDEERQRRAEFDATDLVHADL
jgi:hypothetical protein